MEQRVPGETEGIGETDMKRMWLTWDGNGNAEGVLEGKFWDDVSVIGDMSGRGKLTAWLVRHMADGSTDCRAMPIFTRDMDHGDRPTWVDMLEKRQDAQEAADASQADMTGYQNTTELAGLLKDLSLSALTDQEAFDAAEGVLADAADMNISPDELLREAEGILTEAARMNMNPDEVLRMAAQEALA